MDQLGAASAWGLDRIMIEDAKRREQSVKKHGGRGWLAASSEAPPKLVPQQFPVTAGVAAPNLAALNVSALDQSARKADEAREVVVNVFNNPDVKPTGRTLPWSASQQVGDAKTGVNRSTEKKSKKREHDTPMDRAKRKQRKEKERQQVKQPQETSFKATKQQLGNMTVKPTSKVGTERAQNDERWLKHAVAYGTLQAVPQPHFVPIATRHDEKENMPISSTFHEMMPNTTYGNPYGVPTPQYTSLEAMAKAFEGGAPYATEAHQRPSKKRSFEQYAYPGALQHDTLQSGSIPHPTTNLGDVKGRTEVVVLDDSDEDVTRFRHFSQRPDSRLAAIEAAARHCAGMSPSATTNPSLLTSSNSSVNTKPTSFADSQSEPRTFVINGDYAESIPTQTTSTYTKRKQQQANQDFVTAPVTEPNLCEEQRDLVELICGGRNVFYTGSAGCGKSTCLKSFVKRLESQTVVKRDPDTGQKTTRNKMVNIIAPTGRAALDINGSTFWTYAGWTPDSMKKSMEELMKGAHGKFVSKRLNATDVLVIDEISMVENHHFERLNRLMKEARNSAASFGGVQLVVTGDFCQLPPVKPFRYCIDCGYELYQEMKEVSYRCPRRCGEWSDSQKWAFCSTAWEEAKFTHVNLTTIHRQSDAKFIGMLQKCRLGLQLTSAEEALLLNHDSQTSNAVKLFPTLGEVRAINRAAFEKIPTGKKTYRCYDDFRSFNKSLESKGRRSEFDNTLLALKDHRYDPCIELKQSMLVVLLSNLDIAAGLVNGSQGKILRFEKIDASKLPHAKDENDKGKITDPTATLIGDHAAIREANIRAYVENNPSVSEWPVVLFQNGTTRTIVADCRVNEIGDEKPYSLLSRCQLPLVAGWAMTVHKSQGMTLNRVVVNLARAFEEGQMYVALSRARSLEGLKVEGLGRQKGGNEQVRNFLEEKFGGGSTGAISPAA